MRTHSGICAFLHYLILFQPFLAQAEDVFTWTPTENLNTLIVLVNHALIRAKSGLGRHFPECRVMKPFETLPHSCFSHAALLLPSVDASARFLNSMGIPTGEPEIFQSEGTKEIYVGSYSAQRGLLLLLEAISDGPYERARTKRGPSLHHLAIDVLNIGDFVVEAQNLGWNLHQVSARTMEFKTAWLFRKGVPTLIEVHQKQDLSSKPLKVSKVAFPMAQEHEALFEGIGLGEIVCSGKELSLTVDGQVLRFAQIACNN